MKNIGVLDNFISSLAINWTMCLMFCSIILFRSQILEVVDKWACFLNYTFKNFATFISVVLVTVGGALFYLGQSGGMYFSEYAINHFYPIILLMFLEFAAFLLMIFNYFLQSHNPLNQKIDIDRQLKTQPLKEYIILFQKPIPSLLQ